MRNLHSFIGKGLLYAAVIGSLTAAETDLKALSNPRDTDNPALPRLLVIGDSISMNYEAAAKELLNGVVNYHRNEGNAASSINGLKNVESWLGNYQKKGLQWDVIQFNHGLHDLKQSYDKATDAFGDYAVPLELYKQSLEKEIEILKKTGARLIWCATTPVQKDIKSEFARRKGAADIFNKAALEVMKGHPEILITDLHTVVSSSPVFDSWRATSDVHFYKPEEQKALAEAVAKTVQKAISLPPPGAEQLVGEKDHDLISDGDKPTNWIFKDGVLTASREWDSLLTKKSYRDFRLHVEFNVNHAPNQEKEERNGNSGVYIQRRYEVQIHNAFGISAEDFTTSYGGSIYKIKKPDKLVSKKSGEWQTYDIVFRAARFEGEKKTENARITVRQNGELIHDDFSIPHKTGAGKEEGSEPGPILFQGHQNPVRFRNIWIQELDLD